MKLRKLCALALSGVHVRLVYLNGDGSEIYTHDFE